MWATRFGTDVMRAIDKLVDARVYKGKRNISDASKIPVPVDENKNISTSLNKLVSSNLIEGGQANSLTHTQTHERIHAFERMEVKMEEKLRVLPKASRARGGQKKG